MAVSKDYIPIVEQLKGGQPVLDTGWRNITALPLTVTRGIILFRRAGGTIELCFEDVYFEEPIGERVNLNIPYSATILTATSPVPSSINGTAPHRIDWGWDGNHYAVPTSDTGLHGYAVFPCRDVWPTDYPGTAYNPQ